MDRDKLARLRKKSLEVKAKKHKDLLDSNASIKEAVLKLHTAINEQQPYDDSKLIEQLKQLKESQTFSEDIKRLENALRESSDKEKLDELIKAVGDISNADVVNAVNDLIVRLEDNTVDQEAEDFKPVRRVIKMAGRFIFDDAPTPASSGGGGGIQQRLIRKLDDGSAIAVVNPNGSSIGGLIPNQDFDYIDIQQTSATVETYVYKQGGVSGTTVQTITVTYTDSTKNDLDKVEYA